MNKKNITNRKSLFDLNTPKNNESCNDQSVKRKRGRPKKALLEQISTPVENTVEKSKRGRPKKVEANTTITKTKGVPKILTKPDKGWKVFDINTVELLKPLEFYVDTGKLEKDIFRGYLAEKNLTCTDEPYKLVVLRKRYNNLYYREISGCTSVNSCPNMFPNCEICPIYRERNKGKKK